MTGQTPERSTTNTLTVLRNLEARLTTALNQDPFETDPVWRIRDDLRRWIRTLEADTDQPKGGAR